MSDLEKAARQAIALICSARLCDANSASSRREMLGLLIDATDVLRTGLEQAEPVVDGSTSDGYHTFNELYDFRMSYNAALFNEWAAQGKHSVHKSYRHHTGELCFGGGYFVVVAVLPGGQISNHYKNEYWDLFNVVAVEKALFEFDGHTGSDVLSRLKSYRPEQAEPVVDPSVESMLQAGRFCDANCTALDHHADCVIGNPSF